MFDEISAQKPAIGARRWFFFTLAILGQALFVYSIFVLTIAPLERQGIRMVLVVLALILLVPFSIGLWFDRSRASLWSASAFEKLLLVLLTLELTYVIFGICVMA